MARSTEDTVDCIDTPTLQEKEVVAALDKNENRDVLTGEPGSHPIGVGLGTAIAGAAAGTVAGAAAGPVGSVIGTIVGGVAGALVGKEVAEQLNPSELSEQWQSIYRNSDYFDETVSYADYDEAFRYGYEARLRFVGSRWSEIEDELAAEWPVYSQGRSKLLWDRASRAAQDGFERDYDKGCGGNCDETT